MSKPEDMTVAEYKAMIESSNYIKHEEPVCDGGCGERRPHLHGFNCYKSCEGCGAVCHVDCPAYKEKVNG